jgi:lysophospholipase L1-like esterase
MMRIRTLLTAAIAAVLAALPAASAAGPSWSSTWATSQHTAIPVGPWQNETLRMVARTSQAGASIRIDLANPGVSTPATFARVSVGVQQNGGTTTAPPMQVTFGGGSYSVTIPGGGAVSSDPVALPVAANTRLLVSLFIAAGTPILNAPIHGYAMQTEYNYQGGDATTSQFFPTTNAFGFTAFLAGVDVAAPAPSAVVVIGDSIAAGMGTPGDVDDTWADYLAARVADIPLGVVNLGVTGDQVIADQPGNPSITSRWLRDVLQVPGVRTVIEEGGVNDLRAGAPAVALEAAQSSLIASAHAAGVRVLLTTLTPCGGVSGAPCDVAFETQRLAYNAWVRSGASGADGFADFDAALGGYGSGGVGVLNPVYDCGDRIHPNAAGNAVMANVIDVTKL